MAFISSADEFITSLAMSINGNWKLQFLSYWAPFDKSFPLLTASTDFFYSECNIQHFCMNVNFRFIKKRCCHNTFFCFFFCRTAREAHSRLSLGHFGASSCSHGLGELGETRGRSGCTIPGFALGCRSWGDKVTSPRGTCAGVSFCAWMSLFRCQQHSQVTTAGLFWPLWPPTQQSQAPQGCLLTDNQPCGDLTCWKSWEKQSHKPILGGKV